MPTIEERGQRLVDFLGDLFPDWRILPSLIDHREATRHGSVLLPEIRVLLESAKPEALRWRLEFAQGDLTHAEARRVGSAGLLTAAETLRSGIATDDPWRIVSGSPGLRSSVADTWVEILEEPLDGAAPPTETEWANPQALFSGIAGAAFWADGTVPAGTSEFAGPDNTGAPVAAGDHVLIAGSAGMEYLGPLLSVDEGYRTLYETSRVYTGGITLLRLSGRVSLQRAARETETSRTEDWQRVSTTLSGRRFAAAFAPASALLKLEGDSIEDTEARAFADEMNSSLRPSRILVRRDRSIVEATTESVTHGNGKLVAIFRIFPPEDLAAFQEVLP